MANAVADYPGMLEIVFLNAISDSLPPDVVVAATKLMVVSEARIPQQLRGIKIR